MPMSFIRFKSPAILLPTLLASAGLLMAPPAVRADAATDLLELKNTILNLVDELVSTGVISAERAAEMKSQAALKAREQAAEAAIAAGRAGQAPAAQPGAPGSPPVVRVPYVPEFVKDEIRAEVREELRQDVTADVVAVARAERWGTPDALPGWVSGLSLSGDFRLRGVGLFQDESNFLLVPDFQVINEAGGFNAAGADAYLTTQEDVLRGQVRLRLGLTAAINDDWSVVARLATGNDMIPTTRNQNLGTDNRPFDLYLDLAYAQWRLPAAYGPHALTVRGGRLLNPFFGTELAFDDDLTFDGLTVAYRWNRPDSAFALFGNAGAFSLLPEDASFVDGDSFEKRWFGAQLGADFRFTDELLLTLAAAYYDFDNVVGRRNEPGQSNLDWTAPAFIAKGNTVFNIRNEVDPQAQLFALASEFELVNASFALDYSGFSPVHVILRGDFLRNTGFSEADVSARTGAPVAKRNTAWLTQVEVGNPVVRARGQWRAFAGYRYLERDALLDSFADSDFRAGGTDAEGWLAGLEFGIARNTWIRARWLSADEIDGTIYDLTGPLAPLAIDVLQVDLNAQF